jgi:hypothetical protein
MSKANPQGIDRHGLDATFEADEIAKSNLILEGEMLSAQEPDAAANRFARAAEIEERLGAVCGTQGLANKSWLHLFSAASCWARAGNFYEAICLADELLAQSELPVQLRQRVQEFSQAIRLRRHQWTAGLTLSASAPAE